MDHNNRQAEKLLERYKQGLCTDEEIRLLHETLLEFTDAGQLPDAATIADSQERIWSRLEKEGNRTRRRRPLLILSGYAAAALVLIAVAIAVYFIQGQQQQPARDIDPGGNRATLTLADGRKVELSTDQEVIVIGDDGIMYADGTGVLSQEAGKSGSQEGGLPATDLQLTTPKGGNYRIVLPDGSKVWLNAASTLRYPIRFSGGTRTVEIEGEAYFSVTHRTGEPATSQTANGKEQPAPFIVKTRGQETVVLGTEFSISAYPDQEAVKTTLASGSVRVTPLKGSMAHQSPVINHQSLILAPGEQSTLHKDGRLQKAKTDVSSDIAWKNNDFIFNNTPLTDIMYQLERWYDVEVIDIHDLPDKRFYGQMSRSVQLSQVLEMIRETSKISFTIEEGRRLRLKKE